MSHDYPTWPSSDHLPSSKLAKPKEDKEIHWLEPLREWSATFLKTWSYVVSLPFEIIKFKSHFFSKHQARNTNENVMPWWSQKEQDDEKKMGQKKQLKTIFDTFDSMFYIWIQNVLLTMKTFILLIHHSNVVLVLLLIFFWRKKSQPPKVHFYSISKQMILPPWSSPANPSSSEGTCPKPTTTHANTTRRRRQETKEKFIVFSIARSFITTPAHLPTSGRRRAVARLGLSLAPAWHLFDILGH